MSDRSLGIDHEDWDDTAAAYVLGALEPTELGQFERHLRGCERCEERVEAYRPALDALAFAPPALEAPDSLRGSVMAVVHADAQRRAREASVLRRERHGRSWVHAIGLRPARLAALAALFVLLAGGLGGLLTTRTRDVPPPRVLAAGLVPKGGRATLELRGHGGLLRVRGLPNPPAGEEYQVWVKAPGGKLVPTDALFTVRQRDSSATVAVPGDLSRTQAVYVTSEPRGGSRHPTSSPVVGVRLA